MKCKKSDILSECEYSKDNCFGYKRGELMDYKHLIRFFLQKLKKDNIGAYAVYHNVSHPVFTGISVAAAVHTSE